MPWASRQFATARLCQWQKKAQTVYTSSLAWQFASACQNLSFVKAWAVCGWKWERWWWWGHWLQWANPNLKLYCRLVTGASMTSKLHITNPNMLSTWIKVLSCSILVAWKLCMMIIVLMRNNYNDLLHFSVFAALQNHKPMLLCSCSNYAASLKQYCIVP